MTSELTRVAAAIPHRGATAPVQSNDDEQISSMTAPLLVRAAAAARRASALIKYGEVARYGVTTIVGYGISCTWARTRAEPGQDENAERLITPPQRAPERGQQHRS